MSKVTVWYMTPEELAEYVKKYPIRTSEKPKGAAFETVNLSDKQHKQAKETRLRNSKGNRFIDKIDKSDVLKRYIAGEKYNDMAKSLEISLSALDYVIRQYRKSEPDLWPKRQNKGKQKVNK